MADFTGRLVLVTGAASGIGRAVALAFADAGARVLCVDRDAEGAEMVARGCPGSAAHTVDVSDAQAVDALAERVARERGVPEVLVNNAGVGLSGAFLDTSLDDWEWILGINLMGVIHGCRAFGPAMLERGWGHVVNVSSILGYLPAPRTGAYNVSKAGVLALSRTLRAEWRAHGVGVSAVCPGMIDTPILDGTRFVSGDGEEQRAWAKRIFARRGHPPEAVAEAVVEAVRRDRAVVPVGVEAYVAYLASRFTPRALGGLLSRLPAEGPGLGR